MAGLIVDKVTMPVIPAVAGFIPHFNKGESCGPKEIFKSS
jgi:hypothetical protein